MDSDKYVFFYGGVFSQWYPCFFKIDGVFYSSSEQYMMSKKAMLFGDYKSLEAIMLTDDPSEQKAHGRAVKGFDKARWDLICRKVVFDGNYAKFTQNAKLLNQLLCTIPKELVEASPHDKIWGIGLGETDPLILDKKNWFGTNWLGEELQKVRDKILIENHRDIITEC